MAALFVSLVLRFWYLQIHKGAEFAQRASNNRLHERLIYAPRGFLQDRNGVLLVKNRPAFTLVLNQQDCPDVPSTLAQISNWTGIPLENLLTRYQQEKQKSQRLEPIILIADMSFEQVARIEPYVQRLPELSIDTHAVAISTPMALYLLIFWAMWPKLMKKKCPLTPTFHWGIAWVNWP